MENLKPKRVMATIRTTPNGSDPSYADSSPNERRINISAIGDLKWLSGHIKWAASHDLVVTIWPGE